MTWPPRRILVGTDFSESARAALAAAAGLARRVGAKLTLLHVAPGPRTAGRAGAAPARLSALAAGFAPELTELELREGDSVAELVAARDRGDFDLLVLGAGGLTGMRRFVLGSVAGKMLGHPGCPLLLVLEPPPAGEFKKILVAHENPRVSLPWLELGLRVAHVERAEPGPVVNHIARSGVPAFLVVWPEPESDEDFEAL